MDKKKILIVDDDQSVRLTVCKTLRKDHIVLEASNGEEAIDIAKEQQPALILMDLMMPKTDGYVACSIIKSDPVTMAIPVVMLTAIGHELNKKFAEEMGADGYITKPFMTSELHSTIGKVLSRHH